jgi:Fe-S-cluster containining protein
MPNEPGGQPAEFEVNLKIGGRKLKASAPVPTGPVRPVGLLPLIQALDDAVIGAAIEDVTARGKKISCQAGCGACCRQLAPISPIEARYLAELVEQMPKDRRAAIRRRFEEALAEFDRRGLLDRLRAVAGLAAGGAEGGQLDNDAKLRLAADYFQAHVACPFLEDESCSIHPHRPLTCREFLVTSPAENCSGTVPEKMEKVHLPLKLTQILYRFSDGKGQDATRFVPLVLALQWAAANDPAEEPQMPSHEMFGHFLAQFARPTEKTEADP